MKVSMIVLAIALTACGKETKVIEQVAAPATAEEAGEPKEEPKQAEQQPYNDADLKAQLEAMKQKIGELETMVVEAGKPETLEERWAREDAYVNSQISAQIGSFVMKQTTSFAQKSRRVELYDNFGFIFSRSYSEWMPKWQRWCEMEYRTFTPQTGVQTYYASQTAEQCEAKMMRQPL